MKPVPTIPADDSQSRRTVRDALFQQVESLTGVGAWTWEPPEFTAWSDQLYRVLGLEPGSAPLTAEGYLMLVAEPDRDRVRRALAEDVRSPQGFHVEHDLVRPDGAVRTVQVLGRAVTGPDGTVQYGLGTIQDVTDERRASRELTTARDFFAGVLSGATEQAIIGLDPDGMVTVFNTGAERLLGYRADEMVGHKPATALHDRREIDIRASELGVPADFRAVIGAAGRGEAETRRWTFLAKDGRRLQLMVSVTAMFDATGTVTGYIEVGTNITARVSVEEALSASEALFSEIFDNAPMGIMLVDVTVAPAGRILRANPALCRITGFSEAQLQATTVTQLTHPEHGHDYRSNVAALIGGDAANARDVERRWLHADGHDFHVQASATPVEGAPQGIVVVIVSDITARKTAEQRLSHLALHDALTGLPNRTLLMDRIDHALAAASRSGRKSAVCYVDLDGFKSVNDESGHLAGDEVLLMVAGRLRRHVRPGDTVARLGGDEFVVLCPDIDTEADADTVAGRLLEVLAEPYPYGHDLHRLSASIGVALATPESTATTLLREADDAMYSAKDGGRNRFHRSGVRSRATSGRSARAARQLLLEHELRGALDRDELLVHGQPVVHLPDASVIGVESLVRWQHPTRGLLTPVDFLDVAENSTLMVDIGRRMLNESCRIGALLAKSSADGTAPTVYVNVSGRQLESGGLHADVLRALDAAGLPADRLVLELTETNLPLIAGTVTNDLDELRRIGVRLAIDDLGTGYSSLSRLTELPVDILKIDRSFVTRLGENPVVDAVIGAILNIGESLHLDVIADGVETAEQERILVDWGCRTAQGPRYHPALAEAELAGVLPTA